jgi:hypothetical protein
VLSSCSFFHATTEVGGHSLVSTVCALVFEGGLEWALGDLLSSSEEELLSVPAFLRADPEDMHAVSNT